MIFNRVVITCGIKHMLDESEIFGFDVDVALFKMMNNDWGELCEEDTLLQNSLLNDKYERFLGVYRSIEGFKFWIFNEYYGEKEGRVCTVLLPEEY